jgi:hypothetical protein
MSLIDEDSLTAFLEGRQSWKTGRIVYVTRKWLQLGSALQDAETSSEA